MTAEEAMREVRRLEITTRHLVRDILAGQYLSVFRGRGVEFSEVREYQPGDDVRTIDWNITARLGTAYVKRFVEERALTVLFLVDVSASAAFGSQRRTKRDLGIELCAVLAFAAERNGDRIGALLVTDRVERFVSPGRGRRHARRVVSDLVAFEPSGRGTDLAAGLNELDAIVRRRATIFIVSDFMTSGYDAALGRLARRHDVIALHLVDPRERALPRAGLLTLFEPESGAWRIVDSESPAVRDAVATRGRELDADLERRLRGAGVDLVRLDTAASYAEPLLAFFRRRERRRTR